MSKRRALVLVCLALAVPVAAAEPVCRAIAVLPAEVPARNERLAPWALGWQYLLQERLREAPGVVVPRLQQAPRLLDDYLAGRLVPSTPEGRKLVGAALEADWLLAPTVGDGPLEWNVRVQIVDLATGRAQDLEPATGRDPTVVADAVVEAVLAAALGEAAPTLEPWAAAEIPPRDVNQLVAQLALWPYTERADAGKGQLATVLAQTANLPTTGSPLWLAYQRFVMTACAAGKAPQALQVVRPWAARQADFARAHLLLGISLTANGRGEEAAAAFGRAAEKSRFALPAVEGQVAALRRLGRGAEALKALTAAVAAWPAMRPLLLARGQLALELGQGQEARASWAALVRLAPGVARYRYLEARALVYADEPADVVRACQAALALDPRAAGDGRQAITELEGDLRVRANLDSARLALGLLHEAAGRGAEATRRYREFLRTPASEPVRALVEERLARLAGGPVGRG
jgi:tetratricopeptide (TPR) repeat protein